MYLGSFWTYSTWHLDVWSNSSPHRQGTDLRPTSIVCTIGRHLSPYFTHLITAWLSKRNGGFLAQDKIRPSSVRQIPPPDSRTLDDHFNVLLVPLIRGQGAGDCCLEVDLLWHLCCRLRFWVSQHVRTPTVVALRCLL